PQGHASSLPSVWFNRTEVAHSTAECLPVTDNHHGAGAKGATGYGRYPKSTVKSLSSQL
ncbi:unnamed protein product, partial [Rangifer tarandus platyrhynchus]